jgi:hypothetical protein
MMMEKGFFDSKPTGEKIKLNAMKIKPSSIIMRKTASPA